MQSLIKKIKKLDRKNKVGFIMLYGSQANGKATPLSDVDVAVYYDGDEKERFKFRISLAGELSDRYDVHIFQDLPLYIRKDIIKEGKVIYKKDIKKVYEIFIKVIREFSFFEKHLNPPLRMRRCGYVPLFLIVLSFCFWY